MKKHTKARTSNQSATQSAKGEVRIIAGKWRGRKLPVLNAQGLRPTGDRMKETLFNWLMPYIADCVCLDAFSGSGSLGFEALSRQAKAVTFIELDKAVANQLKQNLQKLQCSAEQAQVLNQSAVEFLKLSPNAPRFDLVFLDPPFHFGLAQQAVDLLAQNHWLKANALIYVETERGATLDLPQDWTLLKEKEMGQVSCWLFQKG